MWIQQVKAFATQVNNSLICNSKWLDNYVLSIIICILVYITTTNNFQSYCTYSNMSYMELRKHIQEDNEG